MYIKRVHIHKYTVLDLTFLQGPFDEARQSRGWHPYNGKERN